MRRIVDDDPDTASLLAEVVAGSGAETRTAGSAAEALDVLGRWRVDLLLSDIGMPGDDGYSLIQKVRQRESAQGAKAVPAIAITAYARAEDRRRRSPPASTCTSRSRSTPRSCSPPSPRWRVGASRRRLAREAAGCAFRLRPPWPRATVRV